MADRSDLQALLTQILGSEYAYFQPPETISMVYPCIVYKRNYAKTNFADDKPYLHRKRYQLIVIDPDPDSPIPDLIRALPMCIFDRFYTADDLNHDVFNLFF